MTSTCLEFFNVINLTESGISTTISKTIHHRPFHVVAYSKQILFNSDALKFNQNMRKYFGHLVRLTVATFPLAISTYLISLNRRDS